MYLLSSHGDPRRSRMMVSYSCVCPCPLSFWDPTFECHLFSLKSSSTFPRKANICGSQRPRRLYGCVYIYILLECEGARKRSKTWLRGSPRRAAREPEANRGGQNFTKIGVSRRPEKCRKKCRFAVLAGRSCLENGRKRRFFDSLRAPSQLFVLRVFSGFGGPVAERKLRKRFVSAGFASAGVFGPPLFCQKKSPKKCEKSLGLKNGAQLMFWRPISDQFWRTVSEGGFFLQCGARLWAL